MPSQIILRYTLMLKYISAKNYSYKKILFIEVFESVKLNLNCFIEAVAQYKSCKYLNLPYNKKK